MGPLCILHLDSNRCSKDDNSSLLKAVLPKGKRVESNPDHSPDRSASSQLSHPDPFQPDKYASLRLTTKTSLQEFVDLL